MFKPRLFKKVVNNTHIWFATQDIYWRVGMSPIEAYNRLKKVYDQLY